MAYGVVMHASAEVYRARLAAASSLCAEAGIDVLLVSPGPDLRYLLGYDAVPLERLTCLAIPADGDPWLVVPGLEALAAAASPAGELGLAVHPWSETQDPYRLVAGLAGSATLVALDDRMWASKVLRLREAMASSRQVLAGPVLDAMRMRKDAAEVQALREAGAAIDRVHADVAGLIRAGRTEREIGRDIAELIIDVGHVRVDFVIVASGPNGASPHHEVSDRMITPGDPIVIDIGGTMPSGYCSDSTRMYALGEPADEYLRMYGALFTAQESAVASVRPGVTCEDVDRAARKVLTDAGWGELFIHRTGHGIGMETHEAPYIIEGNLLPLEPGMAFSVEPGFYLEGAYGARIEDIVVCTADGVERMNHRPRELVVVDPA